MPRAVIQPSYPMGRASEGIIGELPSCIPTPFWHCLLSRGEAFQSVVDAMQLAGWVPPPGSDLADKRGLLEPPITLRDLE